MTREELEAEIRRALTKRDRLAHDRRHNGAANDNAFVILVLRAADSYATYTAGITADRRDAIAPEPAVVHYRWPIVCGTSAIEPKWSGDYTRVTCGRCKRSSPWRNAAEGAGRG